MPVRNMANDAMQYSKQVEKKIDSHKASGDYKGSSSDEYLSKFMKSDKLIPVVTLVICFGDKPWDGLKSIHEMFGELDEETLSVVQDYKLNFIAPAEMNDSDFNSVYMV